MSKRNQHIEEWLRQAAAQDPEVFPDQLKQQAWGQLDQMLDKGEVVPHMPHSSGSGWWTIIVEALILVGSFTYLQTGGSGYILPEGMVENSAVKDTSSSTVFFHPDQLQPKLAEDQKASGTLSKTAKQLTWTSGSAIIIAEQLKPEPANNYINSFWQGKSAPVPNTSLFSGSHKQPTLKSFPFTVFGNKTLLEKDPGRQEKNKFIVADKQSPETIHVLATKQLFVPVKDSGLNNRPTPKIPRAHQERSFERSPYSLRIAALLPIAEAYGAAANIEYTFQWREKWRVRPYLGAEYLTGFNRTYDHRSYSVSANSTGGVGLYKTDSVLTHFTLQGMFYGKAGVQAAYIFSKWEIAGGIEYRYLLKAFGTDTFSKVSRGGNTIPADLQPVLFNPKQVTGSGNVRIQFGLDYMIKRRLQIGAIYYVQLNRKALDSTYRVPHPGMPDRTSFQIHARYFLRKR